MTIAEFSDAAKYADQPIRRWLADHGFAMALAGCFTFWAAVGSALFFTL
ncbi:MAG: hypothetical protein KGI68_15075 [Alphaproteobacteria bacterium]|nr:hypothetical protein [Alphaproteobacteria bacterium]MDE1985540.1 hypothetical protein [Alphaproteobacteria bacterium]MDE2501094.1 hypothetical protein [Alphaproteobacteria bacterium]